MNDTQWNRYQVFVQESDGKPYLDYGSVHAPDPELALLNARDVFARRPDCVSMWVVPVEAILSVTAENFQRIKAAPLLESDASEQLYYIFAKLRQTGTMSLAGEMLAHSPEEALNKAIVESQLEGSALVWWVFAAREAVKSDRSEVGSDFAPAREKTFRLSNDFRTVTDMRKIRHVGRGNLAE